ncbi:MAG: hypothetical protein NVS3B6_23270 [Pseudarthrobacter sp.]
MGLGLMGRPMAQNLVRAGWDITAWNRSEGPLHGLVAMGAAAAPDVAALRDLPIIAFMLPDLSFIEEATAGLLASELGFTRQDPGLRPPRAGGQ